MRRKAFTRVQNKTGFRKTLLKAPRRLPINPTNPPIPGVAEHRIAKSPTPKWIGAFSVDLKKNYFGGLSAIRLNVMCIPCQNSILSLSQYHAAL